MSWILAKTRKFQNLLSLYIISYDSWTVKVWNNLLVGISISFNKMPLKKHISLPSIHERR